MPLGKITDVRPDPVLTRLAVELGTGGPFVADRIAPVTMVEADSFKYATWGREDIRTDVRSRRSVGTGAARVELSKSYTPATVKYRSLKSDIPDEIRNNDPNPGSLSARRVRVLTNKLRVEIEESVAGLLETATNTKAAPGTKWDAAGAKIRKDILDAKDAFRLQAGMNPNAMVLPPSVARWVFNDTGILELLKYTQGNLLANGMVPTIENMQVIVPGAIIDAANPGAAAAIADVYASDEVYYLYADPSAGSDIASMTACRQVRSLASAGTPFSAFTWRDPDASAKTDWAAVEVNQEELVLSQAMILRQLDVLS